jgi:hypothetical protein
MSVRCLCVAETRCRRLHSGLRRIQGCCDGLRIEDSGWWPCDCLGLASETRFPQEPLVITVVLPKMLPLPSPQQQLLLLSLLPPLCVTAAAPPNAQNITVISLRPYNQSADLTNKDSADFGGDLFFYITDRFVMPYGCRHSDNKEWYCSPDQRRLIDAPNQVYTQVVVAVDTSFGGCPSGDCSCDTSPGAAFPCPAQGTFSESCPAAGPTGPCSKYADCNPHDDGTFHCSCGPPRCWGRPPHRQCTTPPPCNATGKVTIASRYCSMQKNGACARCADGCKGVWSHWKSQTAHLLDGLWFSTPAEANACVGGGGGGGGEPPGSACAWQQLEVRNTIAADCANNKVHEFLESVGTCFGAKPAGGYDRSADQYIECTFQTMLGIDPLHPTQKAALPPALSRPLNGSQLVEAFAAAFGDPTAGGCPTLPPP